jgi:hypothetical protein
MLHAIAALALLGFATVALWPARVPEIDIQLEPYSDNVGKGGRPAGDNVSRFRLRRVK